MVSATVPVAQFSGTPTNGSSPLTVQFNDTSTSSPTGWAWFFGDENYTAPWTQMTASAGWSSRVWHSSVAMPDGSIVLMGGHDSSITPFNDTWRSTDNGATWTQMNASAGWSSRDSHSSVAMPDGSIVLMGGEEYSGDVKNDVWRSTDNGAIWTQMNASAGWSGRWGHSSVAMSDGSIVLMGGGVGVGAWKNDVWRSTDNGETWTQVNASAGWTTRYEHSSVAMPDGSVVLMGGASGYGNYYNDVWRSTDSGATWTLMNANAGWSARRGHSSVVMPDGSIVLTGGDATFGHFYNDVWRSTDNGATWTQANAGADWIGRVGHSSVAMPDGSVVLMGGSWINDTWRFIPAGSSAQNPSHTYTAPGIYSVALQAFIAGGYNSTRKTGYITVTGSSPQFSLSSDHIEEGGQVTIAFQGLENNSVFSIGFESTVPSKTDGTFDLRFTNFSLPFTLENASYGMVAHNVMNKPPDNIAAGLKLKPPGSSGLIIMQAGEYPEGAVQIFDRGWTIPAGTFDIISIFGNAKDGATVVPVAFEMNGKKIGSNDGQLTFNIQGLTKGVVDLLICVNGNPVLIHNVTIGNTQLPAPVANFTAIVTSGTAPLTTMFGDLSTGSPTGWAWYFGDEDFTEPWTQQTAGAGWSPRFYHSSVAMPDGSIVLMGGRENGGNYKNDVWRSTDNGATWTLMNASAEWSVRGSYSSVAMPNGDIVLMGGSGGSGIKNDVWRSTDNGATWTLMNASAGWSARGSHSSVAMPNGNILLMGGNGGGNKNDVWRSTDGGAIWTQVNASAGWTARWAHSSVAMPNGDIILMGGHDSDSTNDVWRSTDGGAIWTQVNASAGWSPRFDHSSVAMADGSIVLTGGGNKNDVWRSTDGGATWTQVNASAGWSPRSAHSSIAMPDGSIVLMGGLDSGGSVIKNDTWRFMPAGSSAQNPSHTYTTPGTYPVTLQAFNAGGYNSTRKMGYITVTEPSELPIARFTSNVTSGIVPFSVEFDASSSDVVAPISYTWTFGGSETPPQTGSKVVHTYTSVGIYNVTLNIANATGNNSTMKISYIWACPPLNTNEIRISPDHSLPVLGHGESNLLISHIYGNKIIWLNGTDLTNIISTYLYDIQTHTLESLTNRGQNILGVAIDGDRILGYDDNRGVNLSLYNLTTHQEMKISTRDSVKQRPTISGDKIVWAEFNHTPPVDWGENSEIFVYNVSSQTVTQLTSSASFKSPPLIFDDIIVWSDNRNYNGSTEYVDIYLYNLSALEEKMIISNNSFSVVSSIYESKIVFQESIPGQEYKPHIFLHDISTNQTMSITANESSQINSLIYGNNIVWTDNRNGNWEIYNYNLLTRTESPLSLDVTNQFANAIYGNRVVGVDYHMGDPNIFMYTIPESVRGDFNNNKRVDIGDVTRVAYMAVNLTPLDLAADFNGDTTVDISDSSKIAWYYVGKIAEL